jgi:tetratricopeptide (TPR) repeat protein
VSGGRGGVLAYYKFVAPRELNVFHDRTDPEETLACMYHETTHYLEDLVDEKSQYPHWISEATAEYFGSAVVDPAAKSVTFGAVQQGRLVEAKTEADQNKRPALATLIGSDSGEYSHYYWGWSFVHFMMETPAYRKKFLGYFFDLAKAKDVKREPMAFDFTTVKGDECLRVFQKRFGLANLEALEKEWHAYVDRLQPEGVKGLEQAGQRAYQEGYYRFRAPRQLKAAIDGGSKSAAVQILYARCLLFKATDESRAEALAVIEKALAANPIEADLWAEKGMLLYAAGREDEAKPFVALAREMNPEDPYLDIDVMEALKGAQGE